MMCSASHDLCTTYLMDIVTLRFFLAVVEYISVFDNHLRGEGAGAAKPSPLCFVEGHRPFAYLRRRYLKS
jgi:hypothetical protein